jgi:hypothetical protein
MKKFVFLAGILIVLLGILPVSASGDVAGSVVTTAISEHKDLTSPEQLHPLEARIMEIREMDRSALTSEERVELRMELREIRKEARQPGGGLYISIGALVVAILLILLLR